MNHSPVMLLDQVAEARVVARRTRSMMAASPAGSRAATGAEPGSGLDSGRNAELAPRAELFRTRVAMSSGTPSLSEGCASCPLSAPEFALAAPFRGAAALDDLAAEATTPRTAGGSEQSAMPPLHREESRLPGGLI